MLALILSIICVLCFLVMLGMHWAIKQNIKLFHTHTIEVAYFRDQDFFMLYHKNAEGGGLLEKQQGLLERDLITAILNCPNFVWVARDETTATVISAASDIKHQRELDLMNLNFTGKTNA